MSDDFKNMRIKLFEEFGNSREINVNIKGGFATGMLHSNRNSFESWLLKSNLDDEARGFFAMFPDDMLLPIAILKNITVDDKSRKQGLGNTVMSLFLHEASDAKNVVLIANVLDGNSFDVVKWYTGWGFTQIGHLQKYPVMVLNNY